MLINTFALFGLLLLVARANAAEHEENEVGVTVERDLGPNEYQKKLYKKQLKKQQKALRAKKKAEKKKKNEKNKHYYDYPVDNDYYKPSVSNRCKLTACIKTYEWKGKQKYYSDDFYRERELWYNDVSGKVSLNFDHYDPYYKPLGYFPMDPWRLMKSKYYYAPDFVFSFDLDGLPAYTKGEVKVADEDYCEYIDPSYVPAFYDYYKMRKNSWDITTGYYTGHESTDSKQVWVNDGYHCYEHIGKAVYVELPNSHGSYGCGILYKGDRKC